MWRDKNVFLIKSVLFVLPIYLMSIHLHCSISPFPISPRGIIVTTYYKNLLVNWNLVAYCSLMGSQDYEHAIPQSIEDDALWCVITFVFDYLS